MYTVIWQELNGNDFIDKWDRLETKEEVFNLLKELENNPDVCENDVWIFPPEVDEYVYDYELFKMLED